MIKSTIETNKAPKAIGPYSQAVSSGGFLFCSGQIPLDPSSGRLIDGSIDVQSRQMLLNLKAVLNAANIELENVVKTTLFLADMNDFSAVNKVYAEFFSCPYPARSAIQVAKLPLGAAVEIEAIAKLN